MSGREGANVLATWLIPVYLTRATRTPKPHGILTRKGPPSVVPIFFPPRQETKLALPFPQQTMARRGKRKVGYQVTSLLASEGFLITARRLACLFACSLVAAPKELSK